MTTYRTPGVYVEEKSTLPPSVAEVATAIPAFIGYTSKGPADTAEPIVERIATLLEFVTAFGGAQPAKFDVTEPADPADAVAVALTPPSHSFSLYYALSLYFRNGGGPCHVVSVGNYASTPSSPRFKKGLDALEKEDEPTLIVLTDAACVLNASDYYDVCGHALVQCAKLGDRFTILDVVDGKVEDFRNNSNLSANLKYGAAYHPYLKTSINYDYEDIGVSVKLAEVAGTHNLGGVKGIAVSFTGSTGSTPKVKVNLPGTLSFSIADGTLAVTGAKDKTGTDIAAAWSTWKKSNKTLGFDVVSSGDGSDVVATADVASVAIVVVRKNTGVTLESILSSKTALYNKTKAALAEQRVVLPPSSAVAGIYARVDREQGVWKAPANVGVLSVLGPVARITDAQQEDLNVDSTAGKSINAIRSFTGKGTLVWGARTLAGNDNEWRYVPVRRLFIVIEESVKKASAFAVFEPNDQTTWLKVRAMIESYLYGLWQQGALAGSKPEAAYYVRVGLGTTMTPQDVLEGRMIVETGIAAVRPAEFIILRFSHKMQTA